MNAQSRIAESPNRKVERGARDGNRRIVPRPHRAFDSIRSVAGFLRRAVPHRLVLLLACGLSSAGSAIAADTNAVPQNAPPKDAEFAADTLARYAMPGPQHKLFDRMVGRWTTLTRYWPAPGAEVVEAKGASQRKWILDGRFLLEELDGGDLALPFRGVGLYGFDAFEQKYNSAWVDTMNTSIPTHLGTYDKTNDVVNFTGQYKDPWTGAKKPERGVTRFLSRDKHALEVYVSEPDGREFKMLEIVYTREAPEPK
jgi:hypothetical protein